MSQSHSPLPKHQCPICKWEVPHLVTHFQQDLDGPLLDFLLTQHKTWDISQGVCTACLNDLQEHLQSKLLHVHEKEHDGFAVLPTPLRMQAHPEYRGKGVTICLIDSDFYIHPDLELPTNRIKKVIDITQPSRSFGHFLQPNSTAWHGTMTAVACAGSGYLSNGWYRGIASETALVLLKVANDRGAIAGESIAQALEWVCAHHEQYGIRIVNLSVTDDEPISYKESRIDQAIQRLNDAGIVIVAAVGNDPDAPIKPPANAPQTIAVGGLNDANTLDPLQFSLYHSTFGWTVDGIIKPELIAPAIWIAAPILPGTPDAQEAHALFELLYADSVDHKQRLEELIHLSRLPENLLQATPDAIRYEATQYIKKRRFLSPHYMHVDGTSFAAPIVCAIIAQMLEAQPSLKPEMIREILFTTARRLDMETTLRQGYGIVQAAHAVAKAAGETHFDWIKASPMVDYETSIIIFQYHNHTAQNVALTGDFLEWKAKQTPMNQTEPGIWSVAVPILSKGVYQYKYLVDEQYWHTDPANFYRQPDGFDGFNSVFFI